MIGVCFVIYYSILLLKAAKLFDAANKRHNIILTISQRLNSQFYRDWVGRWYSVIPKAVIKDDDPEHWFYARVGYVFKVLANTQCLDIMQLHMEEISESGGAIIFRLQPVVWRRLRQFIIVSAIEIVVEAAFCYIMINM